MGVTLGQLRDAIDAVIEHGGYHPLWNVVLVSDPDGQIGEPGGYAIGVEDPARDDLRGVIEGFDQPEEL